LAVAAVATVALYAGRRVPLKGEDGTAFSNSTPEATTAGEPLRLATFNIHGGRDAAGNGTILRTFAALKPRPHLAALQEVRGTDPSADLNQAAILGDLLAMGWLFAPTERRWGRDDFGNGVLAAMDVKRWERVPLEQAQGRAYRNYVIVDFEWDGRLVKCLSTHIDSRGDRDAQLAHVIEKFLALPPPCVLMGDLNAPRDHPAMKQLLARAGVVDAVGKVVKKDDPQRIDWIITRGFVVIDAGISATEASDHPVVWTEVKVE
jgi:endonuclease/exonuclease/phosphatase family metal-dependent hydrolase